MSEKLCKDFEAVNWDYINWFMTRKYISRLQTRIYDAALKQRYGKMRRLQKKLLHSPHSKSFSIFTVLQYTSSSILKYCRMTRQEKSNLSRSLTIQRQVDKIYVSSFSRPTVSKNLRQIVYNVIQQAQQILAELAIKPEWRARCFEGFYPFISSTRNDEKVIAMIMHELRKTRKMYVLSLGFDMYSDCANYLTVLNAIHLPKLSRIAIKQWLKNSTQASNGSNLQHLCHFASIKKHTWPVQITIYMFVHELLIWLNKASIPTSFACFKHNSQLLFLHYDSAVLQKVTRFISDWMSLTGSDTLITKMHLFNSIDGFEFCGYRIRKRRIKRDIIVTPAAKSRRLLAQYFTKIIKESKRLSAYQLICRLSVVITYWGEYFRFTQCSKTFRYLDYLIHTKLWLWALKRHPMWNKSRVKQKYFLKSKLCLYRRQLLKNSYGFYSTLQLSAGRNKEYCLVRFIWFRLAKKSRSVIRVE